jgi:hypothetical protein
MRRARANAAPRAGGLEHRYIQSMDDFWVAGGLTVPGQPNRYFGKTGHRLIVRTHSRDACSAASLCLRLGVHPESVSTSKPCSSRWLQTELLCRLRGLTDHRYPGAGVTTAVIDSSGVVGCRIPFRIWIDTKHGQSLHRTDGERELVHVLGIRCITAWALSAG